MVEKVIKALRNFELKTYFGFHSLFEGEVKRIKFRNQRAFEALLKIGCFVETNNSEKGMIPIPIILPKVVEDTTVKTEQELSFIEAIQDHDELDEAGEPTSEETPEDLRQSELPVEEIDYHDDVVPCPTDLLDAPQVDPPEGIDPDKPDLPCPEKDHISTEEYLGRPAAEGMVEMGFEVQSVEEIPIEKQDENKPELKSDEDLID